MSRLFICLWTIEEKRRRKKKAQEEEICCESSFCQLKMNTFKAHTCTAVTVLLLQLWLVCCDITDGNAEHLKREHSLMKPYQGKLLLS